MDSTKQTEDKPKSREGDSRNGWSKIRSDKPNAKTKSGLAPLDPGLSADRGELLVHGDNSNVDFLPSSSSIQDTKHCQDDKGNANHLHLPSRLLRMFRLRIDRVQMTNTMTYSSTWPCSLA
jgi:hypothetical protein